MAVKKTDQAKVLVKIALDNVKPFVAQNKMVRREMGQIESQGLKFGDVVWFDPKPATVALQAVRNLSKPNSGASSAVQEKAKNVAKVISSFIQESGNIIQQQESDSDPDDVYSNVESWLQSRNLLIAAINTLVRMVKA